MAKKFFPIVFIVFLFFTMTGHALASGFADVHEHWAEKEINKWAEKGLIGGYNDGTFKPNKEVTRAEFTALINRAFGISKNNAAVSFIDVEADSWYYGDVAAAKAAGYIGGYSDQTFRPNQTITRQEAASILARLLNLKTTTGSLTVFKDTEKISAWARDSVVAVVNNGLMKGMPGGTFQPLKSITRAEAVVSLDRALAFKASETNPAASHTIEGAVIYNGKPVSGAVVRVFPAGSYEFISSTNTSSSGYFNFDLEPGEYDITAATSEAVAYKSSIKVTEDNITTVNLVLEDASVISGVLQDENGEAVKDATLLLTTNPTFITTTDSEGKYTAAVLPNRTYTARVYCSNNEDKEPVVLENKLEVGPKGQHDMVTLTVNLEQSNSPAGGGGGGGVTTTEQAPVVNSVTFTVGNKEASVQGSNNNFTVDLTKYNDSDKFTDITVNASSNAVTAKVSLPLIGDVEQNFSNGRASVSVSDILGPLDPQGDGVSLQKLREYNDLLDTFSIEVTGENGKKSTVNVRVIVE
ncbi:MAG: S-layer homology domain-containing protein [Desulfotomaculum sp.]|nr:S-layer homology domain-containing protein [Desulfotomaculum sp.]